jgi:polysaccharide export outer membrane protein
MRAAAAEPRQTTNSHPAAETVKARSPRPKPAAASEASASPPARTAGRPAPMLVAQATPAGGSPASPAPPRQPPPTAAARPRAVAAAETNPPGELLIQEGDTVHVAFPGAPQYDTTQQIQRDGNITLPEVGEFKIAGWSRGEAERQLLKLYDRYLTVKQVNVTLVSAVFAVYVTGAVARPGKILSDRPISVLEAVIEAGVDHSKANLKRVRIIRQESGRTEYHILNLKKALEGKPGGTFDLKPGDVIFVPERISIF